MRKTLPLLALVVAACQQAGAPETGREAGVEAVAVPAAVETIVTRNPFVDADDPALWADPRDPSRALIFVTDKSEGLYVHGIDGAKRQFLADGPINNVDVRDGFSVGGRDMVLVVGGERERFGLMSWLLDPDSLEVSPYGFIKTPESFGEPYGSCLGRVDGRMLASVNNKDGTIQVWEIADRGGQPQAAQIHEMKVGSQTEGCVFDDERRLLYVGEEDVAIWRFDLQRPSDPPVRVAPVDGRILVADVEGLTIMRDGGRRFLIASSQGDSTFPVWRIDGADYVFQGRFRVAGGAIDPVTDTDGVDAWSGPIGPFPEGAIAMHDTCDGPGAEDPSADVCGSDERQQNVKLVDWREVKRALGID
ncbi:MAG: phytase [Thermaurantiacus sp.]